MRRVLVLCGLLALAASAAQAAPISFSAGPACGGGCQGGVYTLTWDPLAPVAIDTYAVTLVIDTTGYYGGGTAIDSVAIKISSSASSAILTSAPGGFGSWSIVAGGINASGCNGSGSGFECADWVAAGPGAPVSLGLLTWVFNVTAPSASFLAQPDIKARYVDDNGNKVGALVSTTLPAAVPEPASLLLLGSGLFGLGLVGRPRK